MPLLLVGISGPSSSGKLSVARVLHNAIPAAALVHLDDFYYPDSEIPLHSTSKVQNWDCPEAIDWDKFRHYVTSIKETGGDVIPLDSLEIDGGLRPLEAVKNVLANLASSIPPNTRIVLFDGFMLFHDPEISGFFSLKLFFRAPYSVLKQRREDRLGYNTLEGFWEDPPGYFDNVVWPEYQRTHSKLFEEGDVNGKLKSGDFVDLIDDSSKTFDDIVVQAMEAVVNAAKIAT